MTQALVELVRIELRLRGLDREDAEVALQALLQPGTPVEQIPLDRVEGLAGGEIFPW